MAAALGEAMREVVETFPTGHAASIVRRAQRVTRAAMEAIGEHVVGAQWLAIAAFTADLTARDYLVVGAESAFAWAWDAMAEVMASVLENLDIEEEADAARDTLAARLSADGYYRLA